MTSDPDPSPVFPTIPAARDRPAAPPLVCEVEVSAPSALWRTRLPGAEGLCRDAALAALAGGGAALAGPAELSLVLADDAAVRELNRRWRGRDRPTNVLSFPAQGGAVPPGAPLLLGDVVLAAETIAAEAAAQGKTLADHLRHLVVHGVLHLIGWDHVDPDEAGRMEALETRILAGLGVADPYREREVSHD